MEEKFDKALAAKFKALASEKGPEPYEIGAWESFEATAFGKKGNPYRFIWIGLAASFLMAMSVETIYNTTNLDVISSTNSLSMNMDEDGFSGTNAHSGRSFNSDLNSSSIDKNEASLPAFEAESLAENLSFSSILAKDALISNNVTLRYPDLTTHFYTARSRNAFISSVIEDNGDGKLLSKRMFKVGVLATSSLNSIDRKVNGYNYGGGLIAEVPLSKNISLNTGLVVSAQTFNYKTARAESRHSVTTKGKATSVDLPINIKYHFAKTKKKELFATAGVSSIAYLKESFDDKLTSSVESGDYESHYDKSFSGFDLAKFINVSFGIEIPLEKQLSILIEPYLKYPIGSSTSRNIEYASAGLNFRLNMGLAKLY